MALYLKDGAKVVDVKKVFLKSGGKAITVRRIYRRNENKVESLLSDDINIEFDNSDKFVVNSGFWNDEQKRWEC